MNKKRKKLISLQDKINAKKEREHQQRQAQALKEEQANRARQERLEVLAQYDEERRLNDAHADYLVSLVRAGDWDALLDEAFGSFIRTCYDWALPVMCTFIVFTLPVLSDLLSSIKEIIVIVLMVALAFIAARIWRRANPTLRDLERQKKELMATDGGTG